MQCGDVLDLAALTYVLQERHNPKRANVCWALTAVGMRKAPVAPPQDLKRPVGLKTRCPIHLFDTLHTNPSCSIFRAWGLSYFSAIIQNAIIQVSRVVCC